MKNKFYNFNFKSTFLFWLGIISYTSTSCQKTVIPGAENLTNYIHLLSEKKVGVVAHQSSILNTSEGNQHLVDVLLARGIDIQKVFAPEHGFRGNADAGEKVKDHKDPKTQLSIISLYGKNRKPTLEQMKGIDILVFDLQDVGVRFYTYISTLHYVMEASAENKIPLIVLDRPNPNIHYVDGPVLKKEHTSFVGMHPVPIVYGMTIGEYAQMINGEKWLAGEQKCNLTIIPIRNYNHKTSYDLKVRPSPNLPNSQSIALYPSLCLLEPTVISIGRGTNTQFQIYGHPNLPKTNFNFTPKSNFGSKNPKYNGKLCFGKDLTQIQSANQLELKWLIDAYNSFPDKESFFLKSFERISGNSNLRIQLEEGALEKQIRNSWKADLDVFKEIRKNYLIYP